MEQHHKPDSEQTPPTNLEEWMNLVTIPLDSPEVTIPGIDPLTTGSLIPLSSFPEVIDASRTTINNLRKNWLRDGVRFKPDPAVSFRDKRDPDNYRHGTGYFIEDAVKFLEFVLETEPELLLLNFSER